MEEAHLIPQEVRVNSDPGEETGEGSHNGGVEVLGTVKVVLVFLSSVLDVVTHPHHSQLQVPVVCRETHSYHPLHFHLLLPIYSNCSCASP